MQPASNDATPEPSVSPIEHGLRLIVRQEVLAALAGFQPPPPELLTSDELAAALKCNREQVRKLTKQGKIPHKLVGDLRRYILKDVLAATDLGVTAAR